MATTVDFIEYVCEQITGTGAVRYRKMFGEYMVYVNDKPVLLVCDNTVYIKKHAILADRMKDAELGAPYQSAKEHYVLDIDDGTNAREIVALIEPVTPLPKKKNSTAKSKGEKR